jgi:hypothetical protein
VPLSNAQRQARWREKRNALARGNPLAIAQEFDARAKRQTPLSAAERAALARELEAAAAAWRRNAAKAMRVVRDLRKR